MVSNSFAVPNVMPPERHRAVVEHLELMRPDVGIAGQDLA
jgi:hypothetical protein